MFFPYNKNLRPNFSALEIDWSNPLTRGLKSFILFGGPGETRDLVVPSRTFTHTLATGGVNKQGRGVTIDPTDTSAIIVPSPGVTILGRSSGHGDTTICIGGSLNTSGLGRLLKASSGRLISISAAGNVNWGYDGVIIDDADSITPTQQPDHHNFCFAFQAAVHSGREARYFDGGVLAFSIIDVADGWQTANWDEFFGSAFNEEVSGTFNYVGFWQDHAFTKAEGISITDAPFQVIKQRLPLIVMAPAPAGASTGTGALTFGPIAIAGTGDMQADGTGGLVLSRPSIAGTGVAGADGTGALALGPPLIAGTAVEEFIGSGALALAVPTIAGTGSHSTDATDGTGALLLGVPSIVGTGIEEFAATAALLLGVPAISGTGIEELIGSGTLTIAKPLISGTAIEKLIGSGALVIAKPSIAGTGVAGADGVGILTISVIVITGTGFGGVVAALAGLFPRIRRRRRR